MMNHEYTMRVEKRGNRYTVIREITFDDSKKQFTKWDFLSDYEKADLTQTLFNANGTGECSECGEELHTEADFAKHFIVPDLRYLNLGYCPNKKKDPRFFGPNAKMDWSDE